MTRNQKKFAIAIKINDLLESGKKDDDAMSALLNELRKCYPKTEQSPSGNYTLTRAYYIGRYKAKYGSYR